MTEITTDPAARTAFPAAGDGGSAQADLQRTCDDLLAEGPPAMEGPIVLPSSVRVADLAELKQTCDRALGASCAAALELDGSAVDAVDAAALQYFAALRLACQAAGRAFAIVAPSANLLSAARSAGFTTHIGAAS